MPRADRVAHNRKLSFQDSLQIIDMLLDDPEYMLIEPCTLTSEPAAIESALARTDMDGSGNISIYEMYCGLPLHSSRAVG